MMLQMTDDGMVINNFLASNMGFILSLRKNSRAYISVWIIWASKDGENFVNRYGVFKLQMLFSYLHYIPSLKASICINDDLLDNIALHARHVNHLFCSLSVLTSNCLSDIFVVSRYS
jgi:hypothetical protein